MFDASQYAFFGNDVVEEVELGGLEDEEEDEIEYVPAVGGGNEVQQLDGVEVSFFNPSMYYLFATCAQILFD